MTEQPPIQPHTRSIRPEQTHALRHAVLRPHQRIEQMVYDGDDLPTTLHLGAFASESPAAPPVGIASLYRTPMPGDPRDTDLRLRGMAVDPVWQGKGLGTLLVRAGLDAAGQHGGKRIWCNTRDSARGFYTSLGFDIQGEPFDIPGIGPHYLMSIAIDV